MHTKETIHTFIGSKHSICLENDKVLYRISITGLGIIAESAVFRLICDTFIKHIRRDSGIEETVLNSTFNEQVFIPCGLPSSKIFINGFLMECIQTKHTCMKVTFELPEGV